ncbi:helix-turn-helix domain-containing protein [Streptomyces noursei]|uniref:GlxA family transcriptional regulator n=1 Tax=Streptomyces noursei TaxID=1971 RepID=UPI003316599F
MPAVHRVVALVRPPQSTFELGCAAEVFGIERTGIQVRYAFEVCTERPGPVATLAGYDMFVPAGLAALDRADTVVVPGWLPPEEPPAPAVVRALRRAHDRGARLVSICSGAFALGHAGLLDGRRATTHWARADQLAALFPAVQVDPDVLYVDHGDVATSAGAGAGIDLCLHLVRADHGAGYAAQVARSMVMPPHREGGQLQYTAPPHPIQLDGSLAPLLEWMTARLGEPLPVEELAAREGVSARTLARRFADQLGVSPGQWLLARRIAAARELLESTDLPLEAVARRVGLSSPTNLRRRFLRAVGTTPGAYRRAFRAGA